MIEQLVQIRQKTRLMNGISQHSGFKKPWPIPHYVCETKLAKCIMSTAQLPYFSRIQNGSKTLQNLSNCFPYLFPCFTIATHDKLNCTLKLKTVKLIWAKQIGHWQSRRTLAGKYLSFMWVADLSTDFWWKFMCYCSVRKLLVWYCRNETNSAAKLFSRDSLQLNNFLFHNPKVFCTRKVFACCCLSS